MISVRSEVQVLPGPPEVRSQEPEARRVRLFWFLASDFWLLKGAVAQLGERLLCKQEVIGSIPFSSTRGCRRVPEGNWFGRELWPWSLSGFWPSGFCPLIFDIVDRFVWLARGRVFGGGSPRVLLPWAGREEVLSMPFRPSRMTGPVGLCVARLASGSSV